MYSLLNTCYLIFYSNTNAIAQLNVALGSVGSTLFLMSLILTQLMGRPAYFHEHTEYIRERVNGRYTLCKNVEYDAWHFHIWSLKKINIFKVFFWEGVGHKKECSA